ncbi:amino acid adenylation domain-containing protein [Variovorax sp. J22P271]|nr:amino acid adenylation domain-containing protein [Variovorax sp. J22P271]
MFARQVALRPGAVAIRTEKQAVSYIELDAAAERVCCLLLERGIEPGMTVSIAIPRTPSYIASLLGVLKAGAAYLPVDPAWPPTRVAAVIDTAAAALLVVGERAPLPELPHVPRMVLSEDIFNPGKSSAAAPPQRRRPVSGADVAYVCFTSGSSGTPKGALIPHRGVVSLVLDQNYAHFSERTVTLHHTSPGFDVAAAEIWTPLLNGGTCVLLSGELVSIGRIGAAIRAGNVNTMFITTSLFNVIVDTSVEILERLTSVFIGGEAQSPRHVRTASARLPNVEIMNLYGPTEASVTTTFFPLDKLAPKAKNVPIGRSIRHREILLVGANGTIAQPGEAGEIWIAGPGLALGYVNRPDLTAERFVCAALGSSETRTFYRTGDLGQFNNEGDLEFVGRLDNQVKLNGYRIEVGEIERALTMHACIRQAAVVAQGVDLARKLKAVLVTTAWPLEDVGEFLAEVLPKYMIPAEYRRVQELPRNSSGKVDRQAVALLFDET